MKNYACLPVVGLMVFGAGDAIADEKLARSSGCFECHSTDKNVVGPSFQDIAARYKNVAPARERLIDKVRRGGKGNWTQMTGGVLMPPHSGRLAPADIERLVDWVLGFAVGNK